MSCTFLGFTGSQEVSKGLLSSETLNHFVSLSPNQRPMWQRCYPHFPDGKLVLGLCTGQRRAHVKPNRTEVRCTPPSSIGTKCQASSREHTSRRGFCRLRGRQNPGSRRPKAALSVACWGAGDIINTKTNVLGALTILQALL